MKKFVVIMISALVLFTFLMLNYLVWDKEKLQNQRESDKIEQDWLRGQNRILNTTVEELEQANKKLEKETLDQKDMIIDLEAQTELFQQREANILSQVENQTQVINLYKSLLLDDVRASVENWLSLINQKEYAGSFDSLSENFKLFDKAYGKEEYIDVISAFESITVAEKSEGMTNEPFTIVENPEPEIVRAQIIVQAYIAEEMRTKLPEIKDGINIFELSLTYNNTANKWAILAVITKKDGNP